MEATDAPDSGLRRYYLDAFRDLPGYQRANPNATGAEGVKLFPVPCLTCRKLTRFGSRCERCTSAVEAQRGPRDHYGGEWAKLSKAAIAAHPWCSNCGRRDDLTTDHIKPRSLEKGVRVLCRACQNVVYRREQKP